MNSFFRNLLFLIPVLGLCLLLYGCGTVQTGSSGSSGEISSTGSTSSTAKPYTVKGKTYRPLLSANGYREEGVASWYGRDFHGRKTASGETYNMNAMTAAHKLLPMGTKVRVTHLKNGKSIVVRINDRGPFAGGRVIDLSYAGAKALNMIGTGTARVRIEAVGGVKGAVAGDLSGRFYVQIAALSKESSARALMQKLQKARYASRIVFASGPALWRVQAGPFSSLNRAEDALDRLRSAYPDGFVVAD